MVATNVGKICIKEEVRNKSKALCGPWAVDKTARVRQVERASGTARGVGERGETVRAYNRWIGAATAASRWMRGRDGRRAHDERVSTTMTPK